MKSQLHKSVKLAQNSTGLAISWYNAWVPRSRKEHAVIFEDDIVLSPHWLRWLVHMWCTYGEHRQPAAISLQKTLASHEREAGVHFEHTKGADFRLSQTLGRMKFPVEIQNLTGT